MIDASKDKLEGLKVANRTARSTENVNGFQVSCAMAGASSGAAFLIMPSIYASLGGTGAWMVIVLSGLISCAGGLLWLMALKLLKTESTLGALMKHAFGPVWGVVSALCAASCLVKAAYCLGVLACAAKGLLIRGASIYIIALTLAAVAGLVLSGDLLDMARMAEISSYFLFAAALLSFLCVSAMTPANVLPLFDLRDGGTFALLAAMLFSASGSEVVPVFYPKCAHKEKLPGFVLLGSLMAMGVNLILYFCVEAVFGIYSTASYTWPVVTMYRVGSALGFNLSELVLILFLLCSLIPVYALERACCEFVPNFSYRSGYGIRLAVASAALLLSLFVSDVSDIVTLMAIPAAAYLFVGIAIPSLSAGLLSLKKKEPS